MVFPCDFPSLEEKARPANPTWSELLRMVGVLAAIRGRDGAAQVAGCSETQQEQARQGRIHPTRQAVLAQVRR